MTAAAGPVVVTHLHAVALHAVRAAAALAMKHGASTFYSGC
jgi:hypothetical protein